MPKYLLSVHHSGTAPIGEGAPVEQIFADVAAFNESLERDGNWVFATGLKPPSTASVVDATGPGTDPVVTDGPYLEAKEYIGGFWIVRASDDDHARALAHRASAACRLAVEVRPLEDDPDDE